MTFTSNQRKFPRNSLYSRILTFNDHVHEKIFIPILCLCCSSLYAQQETIPQESTILVEASDSEEQIIAKAAHVTPTANQLAALKNEFIAFVHFGPNTFTRMEWGYAPWLPRLPSSAGKTCAGVATRADTAAKASGTSSPPTRKTRAHRTTSVTCMETWAHGRYCSRRSGLTTCIMNQPRPTHPSGQVGFTATTSTRA